jgi:hypothetical protein
MTELVSIAVVVNRTSDPEFQLMIALDNFLNSSSITVPKKVRKRVLLQALERLEDEE